VKFGRRWRTAAPRRSEDFFTGDSASW